MPLTDAEPTLLLTNDDGWDAPGLAALHQAAVRMGRCCVVAPSGPISGCGHRVTTHGSIAVTRPAEGYMSVRRNPRGLCPARIASPGPAAELGLGWNQRRRQPGNRHPLFRDSRGCSGSRDPRGPGHRLVAISSTGTVDRLEAGGSAGPRRYSPSCWHGPGTPAHSGTSISPTSRPSSPIPEIVFCPLDPSPLPLVYRVDGDLAVYAGDYQSRVRLAGGDVATCFEGKIAVSLIRVADSTLSPPFARPTN